MDEDERHTREELMISMLYYERGIDVTRSSR
jgi:hypothetical protein